MSIYFWSMHLKLTVQRIPFPTVAMKRITESQSLAEFSAVKGTATPTEIRTSETDFVIDCSDSIQLHYAL